MFDFFKGNDLGAYDIMLVAFKQGRALTMHDVSHNGLVVWSKGKRYKTESTSLSQGVHHLKGKGHNIVSHPEMNSKNNGYHSVYYHKDFAHIHNPVKRK